MVFRANRVGPHPVIPTTEMVLQEDVQHDELRGEERGRGHDLDSTAYRFGTGSFPGVASWA